MPDFLPEPEDEGLNNSRQSKLEEVSVAHRSVSGTALLLVAFALPLILVGVVLGCYCKFCVYGPLWMQRPLYKHWKKFILKDSYHPLIDYPLSVFVEFSLDKHFEEGGMRGAQKAVMDWLENNKNNFVNTMKGMSNAPPA